MNRGADMRVSIEHNDKTHGLVFKVHQVEVAVTVIFAEEELAVIRSRKLGDTVILERQADARTAEKLGAEYLASVAEGFHLRVKDLVKGKPERFTFDNPLQAKAYEQKLKAALTDLKAFLTGNAETGTATTFEL
jgi:hypothetical protein